MFALKMKERKGNRLTEHDPECKPSSHATRSSWYRQTLNVTEFISVELFLSYHFIKAVRGAIYRVTHEK